MLALSPNDPRLTFSARFVPVFESGVLCDNERECQGKCGKTSTVIWADRAVGKALLNVDIAKMLMLQWMWGVAKLDRMKSEIIGGETKVEEISSRKFREKRLR